MTGDEWKSLSEGDLIRHKMASEAYTVMGNYHRYGVLLARNTLAHNPREWDLVATARYTMNEDLALPRLQTKAELIQELRQSFENRRRNASHHAEHGTYKERWAGVVMALDVCLDKLEAIEDEDDREDLTEERIQEAASKGERHEP